MHSCILMCVCSKSVKTILDLVNSFVPVWLFCVCVCLTFLHYILPAILQRQWNPCRSAKTSENCYKYDSFAIRVRKITLSVLFVLKSWLRNNLFSDRFIIKKVFRVCINLWGVTDLKHDGLREMIDKKTIDLTSRNRSHSSRHVQLHWRTRTRSE